MECDNLFQTDGWSQTVILIKDNIKYKRRKDLEQEGISSIWIQVGVLGTKKIVTSFLSSITATMNKAHQRPTKPGD